MRLAAWIAAVGLLGNWLCLPPVAARAGDDEAPAARAAEQLIVAVDAGRSAEVAAQARRIDVDVWEITDALLLRHRPDVAQALAADVSAPEGPALASYLKARGERPVASAVRAALAAFEAARGTEALDAAIADLRAVGDTGDAYERARVQLSLADALDALDRHAEALPAYQEAGAATEALGWLGGAARAWSRAGLTAWALYDPETAQESWKHHLDVEVARKSPDGRAIALGNLGSLCVVTGRFRAAERYFRQALEPLVAYHPSPAEEAAHREETFRLWMNMASVALRSGRFRLADIRLDAARALLPSGTRGRTHAELLSLETGVARAMGDHEAALRAMDQAERIYERLVAEAESLGSADVGELRLARARTRVNAAMELFETGRAAAALERMEEVEPFLEKSGTLGDRCALADDLGVALMALGRQADALQAHRRAIAHATEAGDPWQRTTAQQNLAEALLAGGDVQGAQAQHLEALRTAKEIGAERLVAHGHLAMAHLWLRQGRPKRAIVSARLAAGVLLHELAGLASAQGPLARARNASVFDVGLEAALDAKDVDAAFWFIESSRAYILLEALQGREEVRDARYPADLLEAERLWTERVVSTRSMLERASRDSNFQRAKEIKLELDRMLTLQQKVAERMLQSARATATLFHGYVDEVAEVQGLLAAHDAFVSYAFTRRGLLAVVLTADDARLVDLGAQSDLATLLSEATWTDPTKPVADDFLAKARAHLLRPLALPADLRRLVISPAGDLAGFPFVALAPLVQVHFVPSGTTLDVLGATARKTGSGVLGVGAPDYAERAASLPPLPGSQEEVKAVSTRSLLGKEANEVMLPRVLAEQPRWHGLHFACHATSDRKVPLQSALSLARSNDPGDDGLLTALEILRMNVPADLTILSACATGMWRRNRLEGLNGLPRAFMIAGSPRVIASLWKVDDEATTVLMKRFHELWNPKAPQARPLAPAEALRRAQAELAATPRWKHPYYWAGWVLWGVGD